MKVVKIIKDDCITGVEYGTVEIPDPEIKTKKPNTAAAAATAYTQLQQMRKKRMQKRNTKQK